jgi:acyl carrier protein
MKEGRTVEFSPEKLADIIAIELDIDRGKVIPEASLHQLGMDSVAALNIVFAVQETFGIDKIEVDDLVGIETVADMRVLIEQYTARGTS